MKTKLATALLILGFGFLLVVSAKANTNEALNVSVKSSGIVVLRYTAAAKAFPKVTILDAQKKVVFSEKISGKHSAARVYNITSLPEGEYFFEVLENGVKTVKSVTYKKETVKPLSVKVTPSSAAGKFDLVLKNSTGNVYVTISSRTEGVVFEDAVLSTGSFKRTYDLSKLRGGEYVFQVTSNESVASETVSF
jgi:hypothetical protein